MDAEAARAQNALERRHIDMRRIHAALYAERGGTRGETVRCDIQTLTAMFYGEVSEPPIKKIKTKATNK